MVCRFKINWHYAARQAVKQLLVIFEGMQKMGMVKPKFNRRMQKNAATFFDPASDDDFKKAHPIGYGFLVTIGIIALMLPLAVYLWLTKVYNAPNSGWMMLGLVGCFTMGVGLFNVVAAWIHQYLGHWVTIGCLLVGGFMTAASICLMFDVRLYRLFDEDMVSFYFLLLLFLCLLPIYYVGFRFAIDTWFQAKKIRRAKINQLKKGMRNFWWYEKLRREAGMSPVIYYCNKFFTMVYPAAVILHLLFGWIKAVSVPVSALFVLSCLAAAVMKVFEIIEYNRDYYGCSIVLIGRSANRGIDCIVLDIISVLLPLIVAYCELIIMTELWKLPIDLRWWL